MCLNFDFLIIDWTNQLVKHVAHVALCKQQHPRQEEDLLHNGVLHN